MSEPVPVDPPRRLIDLEIDGRTARVPEGSTILAACRADGIDTPTREELIASTHSTEEIRQFLGVDICELRVERGQRRGFGHVSS